MTGFECATGGYRGFTGAVRYAREHRVHHDEQLHGVRLRRIAPFEQVGPIDGLSMLLVRPESRLFVRQRAERVARRANRERVGEGGYDGPAYWADDPYRIVPELHAHAVIVARDTQGVGLIVLERRVRDAWWPWEPTRQGALDLLAGQARAGMPTWAVAYVWLHPDGRGHAIARRALAHTWAGFHMAADEVAWVTPFTTRGQRLGRAMVPAGLWQAGDPPVGTDLWRRPFDAGGG